jgi:protein-disulfide isomerase
MKLFSALMSIALAAGCTDKKPTTTTSAAAPSPAAAKAPETGAPGEPLFELDGAKYTEADLPSDVQSMIFEARTETHAKIEAMANEFALQFALAKEKNPNADKNALPSFADLLGIAKPTDDELKKVFEDNKARLPAGVGFDQVKPEIEKFVVQQKTQDAMRSKLDEFRAKNRFKMIAQAPQAPVVNIDTSTYPVKGTGAVTLVEASDYLCPHCQATQPEVEAVLKDMGDKIKFVQVPFALRPENLSGTLARGAICAYAQGPDQFWKYHEQGYKVAQEKSWKASDPDAKDNAKAVATAAGIDVPKFEACVADAKTQTQLKKVIDDMNKAGVNGTPTFFLNVRKLMLHGGHTLNDALGEALQKPSH